MPDTNQGPTAPQAAQPQKESPMGVEATTPVLPVTIPAYGGGYAGRGYEGFSPADASLITSTAAQASLRDLTRDVVVEGQEGVAATLSTRHELERVVQNSKFEIERKLGEMLTEIKDTVRLEAATTREQFKDHCLATSQAEVARLQTAAAIAAIRNSPVSAN